MLDYMLQINDELEMAEKDLAEWLEEMHDVAEELADSLDFQDTIDSLLKGLHA